MFGTSGAGMEGRRIQYCVEFTEKSLDWDMYLCNKNLVIKGLNEPAWDQKDIVYPNLLVEVYVTLLGSYLEPLFLLSPYPLRQDT